MKIIKESSSGMIRATTSILVLQPDIQWKNWKSGAKAKQPSLAPSLRGNHPRSFWHEGADPAPGVFANKPLRDIAPVTSASDRERAGGGRLRVPGQCVSYVARSLYHCYWTLSTSNTHAHYASRMYYAFSVNTLAVNHWNDPELSYLMSSLN